MIKPLRHLTTLFHLCCIFLREEQPGRCQVMACEIQTAVGICTTHIYPTTTHQICILYQYIRAVNLPKLLQDLPCNARSGKHIADSLHSMFPRSTQTTTL